MFPQESIHDEIRLALSALEWGALEPALPARREARLRETRAGLPASIARRLKVLARTTLGLAIDFLTLEDGRPAPWSLPEQPAGEAAPAVRERESRRAGTHPHRRPLARARGERRPGSVAPEPQLCVTPIGAPRAPAVPARLRAEHSTA